MTLDLPELPPRRGGHIGSGLRIGHLARHADNALVSCHLGEMPALVAASPSSFGRYSQCLLDGAPCHELPQALTARRATA